MSFFKSKSAEAGKNETGESRSSLENSMLNGIQSTREAFGAPDLFTKRLLARRMRRNARRNLNN